VSQDPGSSARRYALEFMLITGIVFVIYLFLFGGAARIANTISGGSTPSPTPIASPLVSPTTSP
jgi:hypothetical protein